MNLSRPPALLLPLAAFAAVLTVAPAAPSQAVSFLGSYTQTFDSMGTTGTGAPDGWSVFSEADQLIGLHNVNSTAIPEPPYVATVLGLAAIAFCLRQRFRKLIGAYADLRDRRVGGGAFPAAGLAPTERRAALIQL